MNVVFQGPQVCLDEVDEILEGPMADAFTESVEQVLTTPGIKYAAIALPSGRHVNISEKVEK